MPQAQVVVVLVCTTDGEPLDRFTITSYKAASRSLLSQMIRAVLARLFNLEDAP